MICNFYLSVAARKIVSDTLARCWDVKQPTLAEADRGNDGKTTSKSGLAFNGTSHYGKLRTERSGGSWL